MNHKRVLIAGGGPAGATLGAILAKEGMEVQLIEKHRFPRHHVGESLQPAAFELLDFYVKSIFLLLTSSSSMSIETCQTHI